MQGTTNPLMAISDHEEEEAYSENVESDCGSDMDPSYSILEDTHCQLSNLSIKNNRSNSRNGKDLDTEGDTEEEALKIIESGNVEKLKVEQCKVYLRKNGLRLTGNKDTLIQRIKEHREILNGGGEKKYPVSSFVLNCKGDACMGDVVMFEQNLYEMFNLASRSTSSPPCGKRIVTGRIVKESYGAAKQQHTFTIEVLWSKGEKPLPPLHPLLIKGRNLYRLKTMRQKWEDEDQRCKVLIEKHSRGSLARDARETRVQEKERRKVLKENRALEKEKTNRNLCRRDELDAQTEAQKSGLCTDEIEMECTSQKLTTLPSHLVPFANGVKRDDRSLQPSIKPQKTGSSNDMVKMGNRSQQLATQHNQSDSFVNQSSQGSGFPVETRKPTFQQDQPKKHGQTDNHYGVLHNMVDHCGIQEVQQQSRYHHRLPLTSLHSYHRHHRQLLPSTNSYHSVHPLNRQCFQRQQLCKFYAQGRCKFGDNCKFLHDLTEDRGHGREEGPSYQSNLERQPFSIFGLVYKC